MPYQENDYVFVPSLQLADGESYPFALYGTEVRSVSGRSVTVRQRDGSTSELIATSKCHRSLGLCILNVGDNATEGALLDPLAKSLLQFSRLMLPDDHVRYLKVRSLAELEAVWRPLEAAYSHIVLVGHGSGTEFLFAVDGWVGPIRLAEALALPNQTAKLILSLTCQAGFAAFGGVFSQQQVCRQFIGPFHAVHGAIASQFAQTFLTYQLLGGESPKVAFRHARERAPLSHSFRFWQNGSLTTS